MKKIYLSLLFILLTFSFLNSAKAQGTWKADSTQAAIARATEIPLGIANLKCMHSDTASIVGKPDATAPDITYNNVTYDNKAFLQGKTNGMFYAFRPEKDGTLDVSVKMSANKNTFIIELTDNCPNNSDLVALTTNFTTADNITNNSTYFTTPSVYDTKSGKYNTWDGTQVASTELTYMVFSWDVTANKTYVVGCFGSKMMLRGVNYTLKTSIKKDFTKNLNLSPNPVKLSSGKVYVNIEKATTLVIYDLTGSLVKQQSLTPTENYLYINDLKPGIYFVKDLNNRYKIQKLIIE